MVVKEKKHEVRLCLRNFTMLNHIARAVPICNRLLYVSECCSWWPISGALACEDMRKSLINNARGVKVTSHTTAAKESIQEVVNSFTKGILETAAAEVLGFQVGEDTDNPAVKYYMHNLFFCDSYGEVILTGCRTDFYAVKQKALFYCLPAKDLLIDCIPLADNLKTIFLAEIYLGGLYTVWPI